MPLWSTHKDGLLSVSSSLALSASVPLGHVCQVSLLASSLHHKASTLRFASLLLRVFFFSKRPLNHHNVGEPCRRKAEIKHE